MPRGGAGVWLCLHQLLAVSSGLVASQVAADAPQQIVIGGQPVQDVHLQWPQRKLNGRFLHITDFHPDLFYKAHTSPESGISCHRGHGMAGAYGAEMTDCDSPFSLVNATFDWIEANLKDKVDFVIWTGDSARHDSDEKHPRHADEVLRTNRAIADKFADTFASADGRLAVPVVPTFGNNDILPHNIMYPGPNKWFRSYSKIWKRFIPEEQRHSFEFGGWFYQEVIPGKLAVFSLNSMYLFDRNAAADGCADPAEPGYQHLDWLRVQLQLMRDRGVKAILMSHVPPARTASKKLWDETCWQRYTLWLHKYRDVVVGSLYGHMNIDHFLLQDIHDVDLNIDATQVRERSSKDDSDDDDFSVASSKSYLESLRDQWSRLPNSAGQVPSEKYTATSSKKSKKGKKGKKKKKKFGNIGGKYAERYQLSLISPSVVPNYFPTMRVFDYNIAGLEDAPVWRDASIHTVHQAALSDLESSADALSLHQEWDDEVQLELRGEDAVIDGGKKKKGHGKKGKGGRKGKKKPHKDPNLIVPKDPPKGSTPGPAYAVQSLTLLGYTQYFANLTYINDDFHGADFEESKWRNGNRGQNQPKHKTPRPRQFAYEVEYSTFKDKIYKLSDLTVKNYVKLAYRIAKQGKAKNKMLDESVESDDVDEMDENDDGNDEDYDDGDNDGVTQRGFTDEESVDNTRSDTADHEVDAEGKKKRKKKKGAKNKTWLHFLHHAFVSTVPEENLK